MESLARKHGITILCGMEITTTGGDILAFGLERRTKADVDLRESGPHWEIRLA